MSNTPDITYKQEFLSLVKDDIEPLLQKHWKEIALNQDKIKLEPHWEAYELSEQIGALRIFTARKGEKLVGYFVLFVAPSLHYMSHTFATTDIIFLDPKYRKTGAGMGLIKFAEKCLKEDGVSLILINTKLHKSFAPLMEHLGYKETETQFGKYIGD